MASTRRSIQRERFERKIQNETNQYEQTETESSFLKALEQEDMQRFNAEVPREPEKNIDEVLPRNLGNRNMHEAVRDSEKRQTRSKRPSQVKPEDNKNLERRKSERKTKDTVSPRSRGHRNRFVQSRNLKSVKDQTMRRWHSDSDLLTTSKDGRSLTAKDRAGKERRHVRQTQDKVEDGDIRRRREGRERVARDAPDKKEENRPNRERGRREESNKSFKELWKARAEKGKSEESNRAPNKDKLKGNIVESILLGKEEGEDTAELNRGKDKVDVTVLNASFPSSINGDVSSRVARAKDSHRRRHTSVTKPSSGEVNEFERGKGYENRLINLLMEYFKDLNQEVREFREEKKQMQEQIRSIDSKIDNLTLQLAVHEATTKKREIESKCDGDCVDSMARPDFRQEIRNILADVHSKYHQQLTEHETRMKSVQEKAEHDIQKLMKNIVGKYVELTQLKGRFGDIDTITRGTTGINQRDDVVYNDSLHLGHPLKQKTGAELQSAKAETASEASKNLGPEFQIKSTANGEKRDELKKITSDDIWNRYQFYFPRKDRAISKSEETIGKAPEKKTKQELKLFEISSKDCHGKETRPISVEQTETSSASDSGIEGGKQMNIPKAKLLPPPGLGSSYFEWKQFWCDKLQQRRAEAEQKVDGKACTKNLKTEEQCRNTI
eukprot:Seg2040.6 transcript_id=Seg2040.6/GoldUCD/mRNA.D3Y31 product="hypothetical protein" protein_id=Seg2040.6/GoldUCD/D3Y31